MKLSRTRCAMKGRLSCASTFAVVALIAIFGVRTSEAAASSGRQVSDSCAKGESRLITLGTGAGPVARTRRAGSANLLEIGGRYYLIDAGIGTIQNLARADIDLARIDTIFLTHLHLDHIAELAPLLGYIWYRQASRPINIYGPPGTEKFGENAFGYLTIPEGIFAAEMPPRRAIADLVRAHDVDALNKSQIYSDPVVRVTAVDNSHYITMPPDQRPFGAKRSYSLRFDYPGHSITFTGDTGPSKAVEKLAEHSDILVSEVMDMDQVILDLSKSYSDSSSKLAPVIEHMRKEHLSPVDVGRLASRANVGSVILTHLGPGKDIETETDRYSRDVQSLFEGPVTVAADGRVFCMNGSGIRLDADGAF